MQACSIQWNKLFSEQKNQIVLQVYAVVVAHDESGDLSPAAVSYTSGFYQIPVIGISSRDAAFSDKNIHVSFLRTVPPYFHQADVWLDMLNSFGYNKVNESIKMIWKIDFLTFTFDFFFGLFRSFSFTVPIQMGVPFWDAFKLHHR